MIIYENECMGCQPELPCIGSGCKYYYPIGKHVCDECGDENTLRYYEGLELCENCLLEKFPVVEGSEW